MDNFRIHVYPADLPHKPKEVFRRNILLLRELQQLHGSLQSCGFKHAA